MDKWTAIKCSEEVGYSVTAELKKILHFIPVTKSQIKVCLQAFFRLPLIVKFFENTTTMDDLVKRIICPGLPYSQSPISR